jgi:hypothetical protein
MALLQLLLGYKPKKLNDKPQKKPSNSNIAERAAMQVVKCAFLKKASSLWE